MFNLRKELRLYISKKGTDAVINKLLLVLSDNSVHMPRKRLRLLCRTRAEEPSVPTSGYERVFTKYNKLGTLRRPFVSLYISVSLLWQDLVWADLNT